ncbi:MAG: isopenicillin N synthase-like dioxygenase, partial [Verrucomicrobiales bacterium]
MTVPVVDLSNFATGDDDARRAIGADVDIACRDVGFFSVVGHGVDVGVIERAHEAALEFFDLPLSDRLDAVKPEPSYPYGYTPFSTEALSRSIGGSGSPDLKETYNVGPVGELPRPLDEMTDPDERDVWAPTLWPAAMPSLRPALEGYFAEMAALAATVMDAFAYALN